MPITIRCPNPDCGQKYTVREEILGSRTTCKKCGTGFTVEMKADETGAPKPLSSPGSAAGKRSGPIEGQAKMAVPPGLASPAAESRSPAPDPRPPAPGLALPAGASPPQKIGPYTVRRKLGQGGMGEVWLAHDPSLDRDVAIKTLPARFAANEDRLKRFLREARLAAKLHHTNAVTVYSVGQEGSLVYIAMEYVDGQSLDDAVSEGRPMPWREATRAIRDAATGLEAAHQLGLIHRDIKPANLMRTRNGVTKVADFGLARSQFSESRLTQDGSVFGTPAYMSPEQWQGAKVDGRSDLYSLVCAYYCLLTGQDPFGDAAPGALGYMHCHQPVPDPRQLSPQLPDAVCRILARGLKKKPEERYQSAAELAADLEALLALPEKSLTSRDSWERLQTSPIAAGGATSRVRVPAALVAATTAVWRGAGALASAAGRGRGWWKWLALPGFAAAAGGVLAVVLSIQTGSGTVKIELSDLAAQVTVKVDGDVIDIAGLKEPLRLKAGGHDLLVTSGNYQSVSKSFSLRQGEHEVLHVTLEPKTVAGTLRVPSASGHAAGTHPVPQNKQPGPSTTEPAGAPTTPGKTSPSNLATNSKEISFELGGGVKMEMVLIPAGEFMMGASNLGMGNENQKPRHRVRITRPFYLGKYLVTKEQWVEVMGIDSPRSKHPVTGLRWDDCQMFLDKLNGMSNLGGGKFQLPTEAQWEYACRAGSTTEYCFGDDESRLGEYAWYNENSGGATHPVGQKKPNAWGLFDMHGNAWEWCQDWYDDDYYENSPTDDPRGPATGKYRVFKGGSSYNTVAACRSAGRMYLPPRQPGFDCGLRVSRVSAEEPEVKPRKPQPTQPGPATPTASADYQSPVRPPAVGSLVGADGKWKLPPGAPPPAVAPFDEKKAKEHQDAWAKHLRVPVGLTNSIGMKFALIPPGEFMMGSPKELIEEETKAHATEGGWYMKALLGEAPQHRVRITKPFCLGTCLVTQGEYQQVMGVNPSKFSATGGWKEKVAGQDTKRFPVEQVSWNDAVEFCRKLSETPQEKAAGRRYLLPSEAQWEYACRAGSTGRWSFSPAASGRTDKMEEIREENMLSDYGWFGGNAGGMTHPVGGKRANAWGLYDMHGEVWEWCSDRHGNFDYYAESPTDDPTGSLEGSSRIFRGGGWCFDAGSSRSARRSGNGPDYCWDNVGFRASLVLVPAEEPEVKPARPQPTEPGPSTSGTEPAAPATAAGKTSPSDLGTNVKEMSGLERAIAERRHEPSDLPTSSKETSVELGGGVKLELVLIPAGEFLMGSRSDKNANSDERPQHRVRVTKSFYLGKYPVTQEQWEAVMGSNPSKFEGPKNPVDHVSWDGCQKFLEKLNGKFGAGTGSFQLPTEAQWEYACRAGSTTSYWFGDDVSVLDKYAWDNSRERGTHPVGEKRPNAWGLYDMRGNGREWCQDRYGKFYYSASPVDDPKGPNFGVFRVLRGGFWFLNAEDLRSARRFMGSPDAQESGGIRVARTCN